MQKTYVLPSKADLKRINISDITFPQPDLKDTELSKAMTIANWLIQWLEYDLKSGKIQYGMLIPSKADLAYMLGVSVGTVQNALRYIEDKGYVESKQCIGTIIKNPKSSDTKMRKLTSKREIAINALKSFINKNNLKSGQILPSSRILSAEIGCSSNTTRLALEYLCTTGILEHNFKNTDKETGWLIQSTDFTTETQTQRKTLVEQIEQDLKTYITENLKVGDKMPAHEELSSILKASIKTIHDALKGLVADGILLTRRGRYGTTVIKMPNDKSVEIKKETSIFAPAQETAFYYYEKTQNHLKKMIAENYSIGSKFPSITELSKQLDLSPNTIRKAFANLAKEGYIAFSRGRYGGTFVIDIPEMETQSFKWLAVNPQYTEAYKQ